MIDSNDINPFGNINECVLFKFNNEQDEKKRISKPMLNKLLAFGKVKC